MHERASLRTKRHVRPVFAALLQPLGERRIDGVAPNTVSGSLFRVGALRVRGAAERDVRGIVAQSEAFWRACELPRLNMDASPSAR